MIQETLPAPDDAHGPSGVSQQRGAGGVRASSPGAATPANKIPDGKSGAELECLFSFACLPITSLEDSGPVAAPG